MKNNPTSKAINLNTISILLLSNKKIVSEVTEKDIVFTANQLSSKVPDLKPLGDMALVQLYQSTTGINIR